MDAAVRELVRQRSGGRCEYCRLAEAAVALIRFHVEHIIPRQHGGTDEPANLAYACPWCNRAKGPNLTGRDEQTGAIVPLFDPRTQAWGEHFRFQGARILGLTAVGRVTVGVLAMNRAEVLHMREALLEEGRL